ncbi:hypothetical protein EDD18DRAFT_1345201 [Armillaria luteobubalina]|uniref:Secreted protein n=1 Tax=Armillaria luteobubalina TaxID=153913 RepID=A0AA39QJX3_9AGAR|nr:hypothetical protein EDD18DRAFT_1345201 [Armillaria luteobubalina]
MRFFPIVGYLFGTLSLRAVAWNSELAYLGALFEFVDDFINSTSIIEHGKASKMADNVVGRVDITTYFVGQELNNEYLYGLFLEGSRANTTQLIPTPVGFTLQALVIEQPVVFNDTDMTITSYDSTLRRWSQVWDYYIPLLVPKAAEELMAANTTGVDYANSTDIIVHRAAADICTEAQTHCLGENQQYESYEQCVQFLTKGTGFCRYIHKNMVKYRPEVHCPHVGPSGGDYCIPRNYTDIVLNPPFNESLIAYMASE